MPTHLRHVCAQRTDSDLFSSRTASQLGNEAASAYPCIRLEHYLKTRSVQLRGSLLGGTARATSKGHRPARTYGPLALMLMVSAYSWGCSEDLTRSATLPPPELPTPDERPPLSDAPSPPAAQISEESEAVFVACSAELYPLSAASGLGQLRAPWLSIGGAHFSVSHARAPAQATVHQVEGEHVSSASFLLPERADAVSNQLGIWHDAGSQHLQLLVPLSLGSPPSSTPALYNYPWELETREAARASVVDISPKGSQTAVLHIDSDPGSGSFLSTRILARDADGLLHILHREVSEATPDEAATTSWRGQALGVAGQAALTTRTEDGWWVWRTHNHQVFIRFYTLEGFALKEEVSLFSDARMIADFGVQRLRDGTYFLVWRQGPNGVESRSHYARYRPPSPSSDDDEGEWLSEHVLGDSSVGTSSPRLAALGGLPFVVYRTHPVADPAKLQAQLFNNAAEPLFEPTDVAELGDDVSHLRFGAALESGGIVSWNEAQGTRTRLARLTCL